MSDPTTIACNCREGLVYASFMAGVVSLIDGVSTAGGCASVRSHIITLKILLFCLRIAVPHIPSSSPLMNTIEFSNLVNTIEFSHRPGCLTIHHAVGPY